MVSPYLKAISLMEYSVPKNSRSNIILAVSIKQKKSGSRTKNLKKGFITSLLILAGKKQKNGNGEHNGFCADA
jgi:hypothetical protein